LPIEELFSGQRKDFFEKARVVLKASLLFKLEMILQRKIDEYE
jgi:hypothetical protein